MKFALPTKGKFWKKTQQTLKLWREVALPGLSVVAFVMLVRAIGLLQSQEWLAFDQLLQMRPTEAAEERVVVVGIDEDDINYVGSFPIPDSKLATMLSILQTYKPRVIGLDLFRDKDNNLTRRELAVAFREHSNLASSP
ncbi:CHASE2 domain-containing protein [Scytonema sp. PCC 10023]|uniref:CHASE2 domain-containing protein n=1 Tax=Scytonema sp. PCC 10023 TaxID=1680591 RepID=UPI0039C752BB